MLEFSYSYISHRGAIKKYINQDSILVNSKIIQENEGVLTSSSFTASKAIFAVADGVSTSPKAEIISFKALEALERIFATSTEFLPQKSIKLVQNELANYAVSNRQYKDGSCTLAGLAFLTDKTYIFNVGDSRVYKYENYKLQQLSHDHTVLNKYIESGEIKADESHLYGEQYKMLDSYLIANSDGDEFDIYSKRLDTEEECTFLICTDGITDMLNDNEIAKLIDANLSDSVQRIFNAAMKAGGEDNISILLICKRVI